jgi:hypothetical protein
MTHGRRREAERAASEAAQAVRRQGQQQTLWRAPVLGGHSPAADLRVNKAIALGASQLGLHGSPQSATPVVNAHQGAVTDTELLHIGVRGVLEIPDAGADTTLLVEGQQVPALFVLRGAVPAVDRQLLPTDGAVLEINTAPEALKFPNQVLVPVRVNNEVVEGRRHSGGRWGQ